MTHPSDVLNFRYRNHRGEVADRSVRASSLFFHHGVTEWHPEPQMLLRAFDIDRNASRDFAVKDILHFGPPAAAFAAVPEGSQTAVEGDLVNHPAHYTSHPSGVECIQITEHMNFSLGNAIKYLWRADLKNGIEDLEKARWYVEREIALRKRLSDASETLNK